MRKAMQERENSHKYPCDRRTESREKKYPKNSRKNGVQLQRRPTPARQSDDSGKHQMRPQHHSQEQEAGSRGAACKWGEKSTHNRIRLCRNVDGGNPHKRPEKALEWGAIRG